MNKIPTIAPATIPIKPLRYKVCEHIAMPPKTKKLQTIPATILKAIMFILIQFMILTSFSATNIGC